jgi:hypothetical protein
MDASLTQPEGESKIQSLVEHMKESSTSLPPPTPSTLRIRATALATAASSLTTEIFLEIPAHLAWVRKGAVLTIQRAYRAWMKKKGEKKYQKIGSRGGCTAAFAAHWWFCDPVTDAHASAIIVRCVPALFIHLIEVVRAEIEREARERAAREKLARKQAKAIAERLDQVQNHPIRLNPPRPMTMSGEYEGKYLVVSFLAFLTYFY